MAHGNPRVGCHHHSRWCQQWVSSPTMLLLWCPDRVLIFHWCWSSEWSHISPFCKLCHTRAHGNQTGTHCLPRDGTAQLRSAQCIGTRSHSSSHTHTLTHTPSLSISLTLTAATAVDADAAAGATAELFPALLTLGFRGNSFLCALSFAWSIASWRRQEMVAQSTFCTPENISSGACWTKAVW